jgi:antirestriction protein ArdC
MNTPQAELTKTMLDAIKGNTFPWRQAWFENNTGMPSNIAGRKYSGGNVMTLACHAANKGIKSRWWATRPQWDKLGGRVTGNPFDAANVAFVKLSEKQGGLAVFARTYKVFNIEHVEARTPDAEKRLEKFRHQTAWQGDFLKAELLFTRHAIVFTESDRAAYVEQTDNIEMPHKRRFRSPAHYYETGFHELFHWAMGKKRLNKKRDTDREVAKHELAAEFCACFLAAELGLKFDTDVLDETKAYMQRWVKHIEADSRLVWSAARLASTATTFLLTTTTRGS